MKNKGQQIIPGSWNSNWNPKALLNDNSAIYNCLKSYASKKG